MVDSPPARRCDFNRRAEKGLAQSSVNAQSPADFFLIHQETQLISSGMLVMQIVETEL